MDDHWFIFFETGWLYFHRSWTGYRIYQIRLESQEGGYQVDEAWVNRDSRQYRADSIEAEPQAVSNLIDQLLLVEREG
jgi:hypothetical protein